METTQRPPTGHSRTNCGQSNSGSHAAVKNDEHLPVVMQGDVQRVLLSGEGAPQVQNSGSNILGLCVCVQERGDGTCTCLYVQKEQSMHEKVHQKALSKGTQVAGPEVDVRPVSVRRPNPGAALQEGEKAADRGATPEGHKSYRWAFHGQRRDQLPATTKNDCN